MANEFEACRLFRRLQEIGQFSGLLTKCLVWSEPGYYITGLMNINEIWPWRHTPTFCIIVYETVVSIVFH